MNQNSDDSLLSAAEACRKKFCVDGEKSQRLQTITTHAFTKIAESDRRKIENVQISVSNPFLGQIR